MMLIYWCLALSIICVVANSQQNQPDLMKILESNKLVVINFLENELIDKELFCLNFLDLDEQVRLDYKEEKGLVRLVQVNCDQQKDVCFKQLNVMVFPSIGFFHYGEYFEYEGKLEYEALLTFINNLVGTQVKSIPKDSSVNICINYLFNGRYNNGLVNFIRAYDLMKQHCNMELVHTNENTSPFMFATVVYGFNTDFDPLYIDATSLNIFSLDEVVRFIQSILNADYKIQGNKLLFIEKAQVNVTFPLNNNMTTPKVNSTDIKIPNLQQYKLKRIISTEKDFLNILESEKLNEVWEEIKTYHTENETNYQNEAEPSSNQEYCVSDCLEPFYLDSIYDYDQNEDTSLEQDYDDEDPVTLSTNIEQPLHEFSNDDESNPYAIMLRAGEY